MDIKPPRRDDETVQQYADRINALRKVVIFTTPKFSAPRLEVLHKQIVGLLMSEQSKITLAEGIGLLEIVKADLITQALENI